MKIAIIETGEPPAPLSNKYPSYPEMFEIIFAQQPHFSFRHIAMATGAAAPQISDFDGLLITGSPAGVYEGHDWIAPLEALIVNTAAAGKPQVGICFGHQIMAQAFGGAVEKSDRGWGVGIHTYQIHQPRAWMTPEQSHISCVVSHQDQVVDLPAGAHVIAGSEFCPNGALAYRQGPAISFQMHPEFPHAFARDLLDLRRNRIPAAIVEAGVASFANRSDRHVMAEWIANFYTAAR